jgi:hypothetical protein
MDTPTLMNNRRVNKSYMDDKIWIHITFADINFGSNLMESETIPICQPKVYASFIAMVFLLHPNWDSQLEESGAGLVGLDCGADIQS